MHQEIALGGFDTIAPEQLLDLAEGGLAPLELVLDVLVELVVLFTHDPVFVPCCNPKGEHIKAQRSLER
jgi:hypothetical protein